MFIFIKMIFLTTSYTVLVESNDESMICVLYVLQLAQRRVYDMYIVLAKIASQDKLKLRFNSE